MIVEDLTSWLPSPIKATGSNKLEFQAADQKFEQSIVEELKQNGAPHFFEDHSNDSSNGSIDFSTIETGKDSPPNGHHLNGIPKKIDSFILEDYSNPHDFSSDSTAFTTSLPGDSHSNGLRKEIPINVEDHFNSQDLSNGYIDASVLENGKIPPPPINPYSNGVAENPSNGHANGPKLNGHDFLKDIHVGAQKMIEKIPDVSPPPPFVPTKFAGLLQMPTSDVRALVGCFVNDWNDLKKEFPDKKGISKEVEDAAVDLSSSFLNTSQEPVNNSFLEIAHAVSDNPEPKTLKYLTDLRSYYYNPGCSDEDKATRLGQVMMEATKFLKALDDAKPNKKATKTKDEDSLTQELLIKQKEIENLLKQNRENLNKVLNFEEYQIKYDISTFKLSSLKQAAKNACRWEIGKSYEELVSDLQMINKLETTIVGNINASNSKENDLEKLVKSSVSLLEDQIKNLPNLEKRCKNFAGYVDKMIKNFRMKTEDMLTPIS